ncbi:MAG: hypothetical protein IK066_01710, partial [Kiritimatiellae bacterium]|nr:hypothetical protein [Kiritimatiellia bacterium]
PAAPEAPVAAPLPAPIPLPPAPTTNAAALAKPKRRTRTPPYTRSDADIAPTPVAIPALDTLSPAAPARDPTPIVAPSSPSSPSPLPASFKLIPLEGQGKTAVYEGVLRPAPLLNDGPTRYRVLVWRDNRWQILCHVFGEAAKFRALQDKSVRVRGREYWVQNASAPVLVPEQIQEIVPQEN